MAKPEPIFSIEKDNVGLGDCVIATWPDGKRVVVTGFGAESNAQDWIKNDSDRWLASLSEDRRDSGAQVDQ